jgi:hypothetical protein
VFFATFDQEVDLKARREIDGAGLHLFQGSREIGFIRDGTVGFVGFVSPEDAALAAKVAHRTLTNRRDPTSAWMPILPDYFLVTEGDRQRIVDPSGIVAALRPHPPDVPGAQDWAVEFELLPEERPDVFAIARARAMWAALLGSGSAGRMRQFIPEAESLQQHQATGRA